MEKQFLINQFKLDKHVLFLIKDYAFENILVRDKKMRDKERHICYLRERINVKTHVFEIGESDEIIEMPNVFYMKIDHEYDQMVVHLDEYWLAVEEHICLIWHNYEIQREKMLENKKIAHLKNNEIDILLTNASTYDASCWRQCLHNIIVCIEEFDMELVPFKDVYYLCIEGRDIYTQSFSPDGSPTLIRRGVLDDDNDTIMIDRHSWWKEICLSSGEQGSVNPSTGVIYKHWSYQRSNIIGAVHKGEIVLF